MASLATPDNTDWDRFWKTRRKTERSVSWSKRRIMGMLRPLISGRTTALDAGCGSGFFAKFFCDAGLTTTALDFSEDSLALTRSATEERAAIVQADLLAPDLDRRITTRFDIIFTDGLFEHFSSEKQDAILRNLIALLSRSGTIVTVVPNRWSPWELIRPLYMPGIDERPFVLPELVRLHERNDLSVIQKGGMNVLPWAVSPDPWLGAYFGMLLFVVTRLNKTQ